MASRMGMLAMHAVIAAMFATAFLSGPLQTPGLNVAARAAIPPSAGGPPRGAADVAPPHAAWRAGGLHAAYDDQAYALAMAWLWLAEAREGDVEQRREAIRIAGAHARRALQDGPANGFAWVALAWARHLDGDDAGARAAVDQSWLWTPRARSLAFMRAALESRWWPSLTPAERYRLLGDVLRAPHSDPEGFARLVSEDPRMATLHRLARQVGGDRKAPRPGRAEEGAAD